ncbi:hypothetical protein [Legionella bononiensis]|uniref:hypothetical protein n=1 Tax=Legionella bononiensis TaxID=2793102 RepID=UPI001932C08F|nr:hypothetical protein [Legionella bononiensis]MBL7563620.1 hypothetical protein [Legionella bononiensis]
MTIPEIIQQQLLHTNKAIVWSWGGCFAPLQKGFTLRERFKLRPYLYLIHGMFCGFIKMRGRLGVVRPVLRLRLIQATIVRIASPLRMSNSLCSLY